MHIEVKLRYLVLKQMLLPMEFSNPMIVLQYDLIKLMHTVNINTTNSLELWYDPLREFLPSLTLGFYVPLDFDEGGMAQSCLL